MYRNGRLVEVMLLIMNVVMKSECCQLDRKRSLLVTLHKDDDVERNYRGIALGCSVVKVFVTVLAERLGRFAEDRIFQKCREGLVVVKDIWISGWC